MKKTLMILTMGLFLGTIGFTSSAIAGDFNIDSIEATECNDKKEDCCKKKKEEKSTEAKACAGKEGKKACCSKKADKKD